MISRSPFVYIPRTSNSVWYIACALYDICKKLFWLYLASMTKAFQRWNYKTERTEVRGGTHNWQKTETSFRGSFQWKLHLQKIPPVSHACAYQTCLVASTASRKGTAEINNQHGWRRTAKVICINNSGVISVVYVNLYKQSSAYPTCLVIFVSKMNFWLVGCYQV